MSAFDLIPFHPDASRREGTKLGPGIPDQFSGVYRYGVRGRYG